MTKYVNIGGANSRKECYHTNEDCKRIKSNYRKASEHEIEWHELSLCEWCEDE